VNSTWTSAPFSGAFTPTGGSTINLTLHWKFTIVQQNASVTVNGTSYANTIQVKQELEVQNGATWILAFYYQNYFARDKGLIKQELYQYDNTTSTSTLLYTDNVKRLVIY
jgi:hypothetical protein